MEQSRSRKAMVNTAMGFLHELVALICGLILPRLILGRFGSEYNGITASISQFISCISLMKAGIGGVTRAALYKPLAENDIVRISIIIKQTQKFMRKIAVFFGAFVFVFAIIYPIFICNDFSWWFTFSLIIIISISTFAQYYFGITYQMLLNADQKQGVTSAVQIGTVIINTLVAAILIKAGASIHFVKLGSSIVYALNPILINIYTRKKYCLLEDVDDESDLINQRWDAVGHEVANFINNNTDIMILTVMAGVLEVSVYTVYSYIVSNIRTIIVNFITSFGAAFGDMYAKKEYDVMKKNLGIYEIIVFSLTAIIYSTALVMIIPFVAIYTKGISDVNYIRPIFSTLFVFAGAFSCFRIPYQTIVKAVGHYKQTRNGAFIEAALHIILSIVGVFLWGISGVAIGALVAAIFRSYQYAYYLGKNVIEQRISKFLVHVGVCIFVMFITYIISINYIMIDGNVCTWIVQSMLTFLLASGVVLLTNVVFFYKDFKNFINKILGMIKRR